MIRLLYRLLGSKRSDLFSARFSLYGFYKDILSKVLSEATVSLYGFYKDISSKVLSEATVSLYGFYKDILSKVLIVWFLQRYSQQGSHCMVFTKIIYTILNHLLL